MKTKKYIGKCGSCGSKEWSLSHICETKTQHTPTPWRTHKNLTSDDIIMEQIIEQQGINK